MRSMAGAWTFSMSCMKHGGYCKVRERGPLAFAARCVRRTQAGNNREAQLHVPGQRPLTVVTAREWLVVSISRREYSGVQI